MVGHFPCLPLLHSYLPAFLASFFPLAVSFYQFDPASGRAGIDISAKTHETLLLLILLSVRESSAVVRDFSHAKHPSHRYSR